MIEARGKTLDAGVSQMTRKDTIARTSTSLTPTPLETLEYPPARSPYVSPYMQGFFR